MKKKALANRNVGVSRETTDPEDVLVRRPCLQQYVKEGVDELDDAKLGDLLILKYGGIADAKANLGDIPTIRNTFIGFQEHLYQKSVE